MSKMITIPCDAMQTLVDKADHWDELCLSVAAFNDAIKQAGEQTHLTKPEHLRSPASDTCFPPPSQTAPAVASVDDGGAVWISGQGEYAKKHKSSISKINIRKKLNTMIGHALRRAAL